MQRVTVSQLKDEIRTLTDGRVNLHYADYTSIAGHDCFIIPVKPSRRIQHLDDAAQAAVTNLAAEYGWSITFDRELPKRSERTDEIRRARVILGLSTDLAMEGPSAIRVRVRDTATEMDDEDEYPPVPDNADRKLIFDSLGIWVVPLSDDDPLFHVDDGEDDSDSDGSLVEFVVPDGEGVEEGPEGDAEPMSVDDEVEELRAEALRLGADLSSNSRPSRGAAARARERIRRISVDSVDSDSDVSIAN